MDLFTIGNKCRTASE